MKILGGISMNREVIPAAGIFRSKPLAALALLAASLCSACAGGFGHHAPAERSVSSLQFIGEQRIALKQQFQDTVVGGLSGIDYDPKTDTWIMESDDRSDISPARFYTARLDYDQTSFKSATLTGVHFFKQENGFNYPNAAQYASQGGEVPDIESIRFDPIDGSIWYSSEGIRTLGLNPFVKHAGSDGRYLSTLPVPPQFNVSPARESGSRDNLSFEGLSFSPDGKSLWLGMETALYQDGPISTTAAGSVSRITQFDRDGRMLAQFAYPIDPIPVSPAPGRWADNGVSEILTVNEHQLLAIERAGVQGADDVFTFYIRIYEMDVGEVGEVGGATDISHIASLQGAAYTPAKKRLVLNLNLAGLPKIDNLEGIAWGRKLANGHDSLVLVSDDNFNQTQVTQFLVFEVLPE
jgi:hypothetical protein